MAAVPSRHPRGGSHHAASGRASRRASRRSARSPDDEPGGNFRCLALRGVGRWYSHGAALPGSGLTGADRRRPASAPWSDCAGGGTQPGCVPDPLTPRQVKAVAMGGWWAGLGVCVCAWLVSRVADERGGAEWARLRSVAGDAKGRGGGALRAGRLESVSGSCSRRLRLKGRCRVGGQFVIRLPGSKCQKKRRGNVGMAGRNRRAATA